MKMYRYILFVLFLTGWLVKDSAATRPAQARKSGPGKYGLEHSNPTNSLNLKKSASSSTEKAFKESAAPAETWNSFPVYGGEMTSIVIDPTNASVVYTGTRDAGVFKTTNGGTSWYPARGNLTFYPIRSLAINPQNPNIIYAGTDFDGIWKTTDGGSSWTRSSNGLDESMVISSIVIDKNNTNIIYTGLAGGLGFTIGNIYKSTDSGATWSLSDNGLIPQSGDYKNAIISLAVNPGNQAVLYAGTNYDGAFISTDSGSNWSAISDSIPYLSYPDYRETVNAIAGDPHHAGRICAIISGQYYTYNGSHWVLKCSDYINESIDFAHIYFHPADTSIIYSSGQSFSKSTDGGANWTDNLTNVADIAFNTSTPSIIYAATEPSFDVNGGTYKSTNYGNSWNGCPDGITATVVRSVAIDPQNSQRIYSGDGNGFFHRSSNGGTTWSVYNFISAEIFDIKIDPLNSGNVFVATFIGLYKSIDTGKTFSEISAISSPYCLANTSSNSNLLYAGTLSGGIYKTKDGGTSWTAKSSGLPETIPGHYDPVLSIAIDPNDTAKVWAGTQYGGGILKTTNGGDLWVSMGLTDENTVDCIAINPANSNEIIVGAGYTDGNIYKSTNGGIDWIKKDSAVGFIFNIKYDPRNSQYVYAASEGYGILRSTNGGETWQDYSTGIFYPVNYSLAISNDNPPLLLTGSYGSGLYWINPSISTGIEKELTALVPDKLKLEQNYPNPFNPTTVIRYELPHNSYVKLNIFNMLGQQVAELIDEFQKSGYHEIKFDGSNLSSGIYFYRLQAGTISGGKAISYTEMKKFVLLK